jgi:uncharacterized protein RhaS with RHS repeats
VQPAVTIDYTYDKNGNRDLLTDNLGDSVDYTFDNLNRIDTIVKSGLTFDFDYDALSRRKKATLPNGTITDYAYDVASQLTSLTHSLSAIPFTQFDYTQYDGVGNKEVVSVQRTGVSVQSRSIMFMMICIGWIRQQRLCRLESTKITATTLSVTG